MPDNERGGLTAPNMPAQSSWSVIRVSSFSVQAVCSAVSAVAVELAHAIALGLHTTTLACRVGSTWLVHRYTSRGPMSRLAFTFNAVTFCGFTASLTGKSCSYTFVVEYSSAIRPNHPHWLSTLMASTVQVHTDARRTRNIQVALQLGRITRLPRRTSYAGSKGVAAISSGWSPVMQGLLPGSYMVRNRTRCSFRGPS